MKRALWLRNAGAAATALLLGGVSLPAQGWKLALVLELAKK